MKQMLKELCCSPREFLSNTLKTQSLLYTSYLKLKEQIKNFKINNYLKDAPESVVYFSETIENIDKFEKWIKTLEELNKNFSLLIVVRNRDVAKYIKRISTLKVYCANNLNELLMFYSIINPKIIFYITNEFRSFQSLIYNDAMHIYLSSATNFSNQIKGYDYIFVSGKYEIDEYMKHLIRINEDRFLTVGRPELEFITPLPIDINDKKVILYSPSYKSSTAMTSEMISQYIHKLVDSILQSDKYFLIYKPVNILNIEDNILKETSKMILQKVEKAENAISYLDTDFVSIYPVVDLAIFDNLSLLSDYLFFQKPFLLTELSEKENIEFSIGHMGKIISEDVIEKIDETILKEITDDPMQKDREKLYQFYYDGYTKGKAYQMFESRIKEIILQYRDNELKKRERELHES